MSSMVLSSISLTRKKSKKIGKIHLKPATAKIGLWEYDTKNETIVRNPMGMQ